MAYNDTCKLFFGESDIRCEEGSCLLTKLDRYNNNSSYNSSLNLAYVRQKSETPTLKLRMPQLHFSFKDEASGSRFTIRKKIISDDLSPLKFTNDRDSDDLAAKFGKSNDVADVLSSLFQNPL